MKQMDDKEIIKTAECCLQAETREDCYYLGCPCNSLDGCVLFNRTDGNSEFDVTYEIIKELLGVINRQQEGFQKALTDCYKSHYNEATSEAVREFSKAVIDGIDEGYISHSSDIVDFTTDYLRGKMAGDTE